MTSSFNSVKKIKKYIGPLIIFSFILQGAAPLIAAPHAYKLVAQKQQAQTASTKSNNFIADNNLNKLIRYIVEEPDTNFNQNISEPLKRCYKTLIQEKQELLPIEDVWQAMPDILQYVVDNHSRAPRPNAPITESNAIVGPGACNTAQLVELLVIIKNKIGCVTDDVCCNTILGILGNACEIFGPDESISSILLEILNTQTTCCAQTLTLLAAIEQDIQDTFTVLEHIEETLEGCCGTFTTGIAALSEQLAECCDSILETQTIIIEKIDNINMDVDLIINEINACCENLSEEILETQSILLECCSTFTIGIGALSEQLAECCEAILDTQTTIIEKIDTINMDVDLIINEINECCENLSEEILETQSILLECCSTFTAGIGNLSEQLAECCEDLTELIIDEHIETRTIILEAIENCCDSIRTDIFDTQTLIAECCQNLHEQITDVSEQVEECCEALSQEIFQTQTIILEAIDALGLVGCCTTILASIDNVSEQIDDVSEQLEECCDAIRTDIFNTQTIITECCESLSEQIGEIAASACAPTPISGPTTITQPGAYCLTQNIVGTITIDSDNVSLDLNEFQIQATSPGVQILPGHQNITVKNGSIIGGTPGTVGIDASNCTDIEVTQILIKSVDTGINFTTVKGIFINQTTITQTNLPIFFTSCSQGQISNCEIFENNSTGNGLASILEIEGCTNLVFDSVQVNNNIASTAFFSFLNAYVIHVLNGNTLTFNNCTANNNTLTILNPAANSEVRFSAFAFETSNDIVCYQCQAIQNSSTITITDIDFTGNCFGFVATTAPSSPTHSLNITFNNCIASNNASTVTNTGTLGTTIAYCIGFWIERVLGACVRRCVASENFVASSGGAMPVARADGIRTTSQLGPTVFVATITENITQGNYGVGINDVRVEASSSTITKNISGGNIRDNYSGVGPALIAVYNRADQTITDDFPWRNLDVRNTTPP